MGKASRPFIAALVTFLFMSGAASAASDTIDIPSQETDAALRIFAQQTGYNIIYAMDDIGNPRTQAVSGIDSPELALDVMLKGTGLVYEKTGGKTISVIRDTQDTGPAPKPPLAETVADGMVHRPPTPPGRLAHTATTESSEAVSEDRRSIRTAKNGKPVFTLDEITVTAERREADARDTPVAVTAFDAEFIHAFGIRNAQDLQMLLPSTTFTSSKVYIRGVGREHNQLGLDPGVGVYSDGYYDTENLAGGFFDLERIEVVRGPQGTLYGRNTLGGTINAIRTRPTKEWSGKARATAANYDDYAFNAAIGGPLYRDKLMGRLVLTTGVRDVAQRNMHTREHVEGGDWYGLEVRLLFEPTGNLSLYTTATSGEYDLGYAGDILLNPYNTAPASPGSVFPNPAEAYPLVNPSLQDPWMVNKNTPGIARGSGRTVFNTTTLELGDVTVKHLMSYRDWHVFLRGDLDFTPSPREYLWDVPMEAWGYSQELQFIYGSADSRLGFIGGVYYWALHECQSLSLIRSGNWGDKIAIPVSHATTTPLIDYSWLPSFAGDSQRRSYYFDAWIMATSKAIYGQADYQLTRDLNVSLGIRYSRDEKEGGEKRGGYYELTGTFALDPALEPIPDPVVYTGWPAWWMQAQELENDWEAVTGTIGFDYKPTGNSLVYGKVSQGYKSGGFILGNHQDAVTDPIDPETLTAYEMGYKRLLNSSRMWITAAVFYYSYQHIQVETVVDNRIIVGNAASAENYGFELEATAYLKDDLILIGAYSFTVAEYKEYLAQDPADPWEVDGIIPRISNLSGNRLNRTPEHKLSLSAAYTLPTDIGDFVLYGICYWQDEAYYRAFGTKYDRAPDYGRADARLSWRSPEGHWEIASFVKNISESDGYTDMSVTGPSDTGVYTRTAAVMAPRRFGIEVTYQF